MKQKDFQILIVNVTDTEASIEIATKYANKKDGLYLF